MLLTISIFAYAGPFGFEKGMTLQEVAEVCETTPDHMGDDRYLVTPKKQHPDFEGYIAWISKKHGLYYIKAISREIKTNGYGNELLTLYSDIENSLSKRYGPSTLTNEIDPDSMYGEDQYWLRSISEGARTFYSKWGNKDGSVLLENIELIYLYVTSDGLFTGYIMVEYEFDNNSIVEKENDSVF